MKISNSSFGGGGGGGGDVEDELFRDPKSWPPGFRFHPTDEELVLYYLKRKICRLRLKLNVIADIDVYKLDPEDLPGHSLLKSGDRQWYFFSPRDRKYPNGVRSNRATRHGYWKATGKDRRIEWNSRSVGFKKTLVFYRGRAPHGERTDWVMHEYTLDEEELKRCKSAQDCYALYKAYKKSGPGPKNGEQYGAPFQEEEWADDSDLLEHDKPNQDNLLQRLDNNACVDRSLVDNQFQLQIDFVKEILLGEDVPERNQSQETGYEVPKVGADKEIHNDNTIMWSSLDEAVFTEPSIVLHPSWIQSDAQYSFEPTQSATSYLLSHEAPEVTSAPNIYQQPSFEAEEDNFLEIDDLIGPQPTFSNTKDTNINLTVEESYGLNDSDLYFDTTTFFRDIEPIDQGTTSQPYFEGVGGDMAGHFDYQIQNQLDDDFESISCQLWMHDQRTMYFASSQSNQVDMAPPNPGMIHSGGLVNLHTEEKQNQENNGNDDSTSRISAAISDFLGSIPTRPALASENALINRAFERMSSFGRVRITARDADAAAGVAPAPVARRNVGRNGGFLFLSILGVLCAISWLLMIGTTVKVLKTFLGRFISSL